MHFMLLLITFQAIGQRPITSIVTNGTTLPVTTYLNVKGAGIRNAVDTVSNWDSIGTNFTVRFNAPASYNNLSLSQFRVGSITSPLIKLPVGVIAKVRRAANAAIGDARNTFCFWAAFSSIPASTATTGTFNLTAPEVTSMETAVLSNNLTSGYDNIFQNTIASPHYGNVERVDIIVPGGLIAWSDSDRINSGFVVIDRGSGDPFKIAVITAINGTNDPTAFGPLLPVTAAHFGDTLLPTRFEYAILSRDVNFKSESRPSSRGNQNLKGVFISLADLGVAKNQKVYGYALFGSDVVTANPDWTTYPNTTNAVAMLDPVNVMGVYKTPYSTLPVSVSFAARRNEDQVKLSFKVFTSTNNDHIAIERSADGKHYQMLASISNIEEREYFYSDGSPLPGNNYYRLKMVDHDGSYSYSEARLVQFTSVEEPIIFPVPAAHTLSVDLPKGWTGKNVQAELFNHSGQVVMNWSWAASAQHNTLDLLPIPTGTYLIRVRNFTDGYSFARQVVIRR
jgi:hypothetical protein